MSEKLESIVTGKVWKIEKTLGETVTPGDVVMVLESMKMEIPVECTTAGVILSLSVTEGESVTEGQMLGEVG